MKHNRRSYQKMKNHYDIANKRLYKKCQQTFDTLDDETKSFYIEKANQMTNFYGKKYKPYIVYAEEIKSTIHMNWAIIPSWCHYRNEHLPMDKAMKKVINAFINTKG